MSFSNLAQCQYRILGISKTLCFSCVFKHALFFKKFDLIKKKLWTAINVNLNFSLMSIVNFGDCLSLCISYIYLNMYHFYLTQFVKNYVNQRNMIFMTSRLISFCLIVAIFNNFFQNKSPRVQYLLEQKNIVI